MQDETILNCIVTTEQDPTVATVILSEERNQSTTRTKSSMPFNNALSNKNQFEMVTVRQADNEPSGLYSGAKDFFLARFHTFMKSKAPTYLCLSIYIIICLLGNIVTGIIIGKHYLSSHEEIESMNNLTKEIFSQIERRENETSHNVDSRLQNNSLELETDQLSRQSSSTNESNITVSQIS